MATGIQRISSIGAQACWSRKSPRLNRRGKVARKRNGIQRYCYRSSRPPTRHLSQTLGKVSSEGVLGGLNTVRRKRLFEFVGMKLTNQRTRTCVSQKMPTIQRRRIRGRSWTDRTGYYKPRCLSGLVPVSLFVGWVVPRSAIGIDKDRPENSQRVASTQRPAVRREAHDLQCEIMSRWRLSERTAVVRPAQRTWRAPLASRYLKVPSDALENEMEDGMLGARTGARAWVRE